MVCEHMKKINNKFRNNNNSNQIFSLNYKFDSISIAGKISGTALDLIKRYNELAKEAHGNSDYVTAEVYRQYAEHYRKIVTEINEKKNSQKVIAFHKDEAVVNGSENNRDDNAVSNGNFTEDSQSPLCDNTDDSDSATDVLNFDDLTPAEDIVISMPEKKEFKIVEISVADSKSELIAGNETAAQPKPKRTYRRKETKENKEDIAV